ncbi:MAG: IS982 family transposase, partial [Chloroflexi bacterium]|nr:IS982 family transposase [Chloroflexota bacterium]
WIRHWQGQYGAEVIAPPASNIKGDKPGKIMRWLRKHRQIVETVIARLTQYFDLQRINAHSELGMLTRIAAKMAAYNIAILFNRQCGRPDGAVATLIC